ncbi:hypothetical protein ACFE04_020993 [Oxalis oulophora]
MRITGRIWLGVSRTLKILGLELRRRGYDNLKDEVIDDTNVDIIGIDNDSSEADEDKRFKDFYGVLEDSEDEELDDTTSKLIENDGSFLKGFFKGEVSKALGRDGGNHK